MERHAVWGFERKLFVDEYVPPESTVGACSSECLVECVIARVARQPVVRMDDHAITLFPARLGASDLDDAGAIGAGDQVFLGRERVVGVVIDIENVTVVQRECVYADEDLFGARGR